MMYKIDMDDIKKTLEEIEIAVAELKVELKKLDQPFSGMLEDESL